MSDSVTKHDDGVFEPDEETLMSALRNQDDIPILMDIVVDQPSVSVAQEGGLAQSFDDAQIQNKDVQGESSEDNVLASIETLAPANLSQEFIAKTIAGVLEKRLPELVSEVMQVLYAADAENKKE